MNFKVNAKEATKIWKKLQRVGFNAADTLSILQELRNADGEYIYYKELREAAMGGALDDRVTAFIIGMLAGAYETGAEGIEGLTNYALPKTRKDEIIQELIKEQIQNPRGKESLKMALDKIGYAFNNDEAQTILDSFLTSEQSMVNHEDIYKIKLSLSAMHPQSDSLSTVLEQITYLSEKSQDEIFPQIVLDSQWVSSKEDSNLQKNYIDYIKKHMPDKPYSANIDHDLVMKQTLLEFDIDEESLNNFSEEEKKVFLATTAPKIYKKFDKKISSLTKDNNYQLYEDSINAIANVSITREQDYYDSAKKMFMESKDPIYKQTILGLLTKDDENKERLKKDFDIKNSLSEERNNPNLTELQQQAYESYLNNIFQEQY